MANNLKSHKNHVSLIIKDLRRKTLYLGPAGALKFNQTELERAITALSAVRRQKVFLCTLWKK
jgi:hypothetical protein